MKHFREGMKHFEEGQIVLGCLPVFLLLSGCGQATPECDFLDTRNTVVKIFSDDSNNALVNYAVKNSSTVAAKVSSTNTEAEKLAFWEKADKLRHIGWMIQYARIQETKPSEQ